MFFFNDFVKISFFDIFLLPLRDITKNNFIAILLQGEKKTLVRNTCFKIAENNAFRNEDGHKQNK